MGLFDVVKTSENLTQQNAADQEAIIAAGTSVAARDEAISLGGFGNRNVLGDDLSASNAVQNYEGGIALGGFGNTNKVGSVEVAAGNSGDITINDSAALESTVAAAFDTVKDANSEAQANIKYLVGEALATNKQITENAQTEGTLPIAKIVMWIAGLGFGAWAIVSWAKSK
jgi:hypothetical protein